MFVYLHEDSKCYRRILMNFAGFRALDVGIGRSRVALGLRSGLQLGVVL